MRPECAYFEPWSATQVMAIPLIALVCSLPLSPLLRRFYSRRMIALMSLREESAPPNAELPPPPVSMPPASNEPSLTQCLRLRQRRLVVASFAAWLCANVFALAMVAAGVFKNVTISSYLFWLALVCGPFLVNLQRQGTKLNLLLIGGAAAVLQGFFGGEFYIDAKTHQTVILSVWLATAGSLSIVLIFYLATAHRTLRAVVVFAGFVAIGMWLGSRAAYVPFNLMKCFHLLPNSGLSRALIGTTSLSLVGATIGLFAVLALVPLVVVERWLHRGWLSETLVFAALALAFILATVMMSSGLALVTELAVLVVWLAAVGAAYGGVLRASRWPRKARSLLVLRVFSRVHRTEKALDALQSRWQLVGPVVQVGGPDLMALNFGLGQFIRFATFRLDPLFQATAEQARGLCRRLDPSPDFEGRFPLHEIFCTDSAWHVAVEELIDGTDVVLLDLRGFGEARKGTIHEVGLLARLGRLPQTVAVFDAETDWACFERHAAAAGAPPALAGRIDMRRPHAVDACFENLLTIADRQITPSPCEPVPAGSSAALLAQ
jgi:hypothetical protein